MTAQRHLELLGFRLAPAVAAAVVIASRAGVAEGVAVVAIILFVQALLGGVTLPMHLMPLARLAAHALVPVIGLAVAACLFALMQRPLPAEWLWSALFAALLLRLLATALHRRFDATRPVRLAVLGSGVFAHRLATELEQAGIRSYEVVGAIPDGSPDEVAAQRPSHPPRLGDLAHLRGVIGEHAIDVLVLDGRSARPAAFEQAARACLDTHVRVIEGSALYEDVLGHVPIGSINSTWFQALMHPRHRRRPSVLRRVVDLAVVLPAAIVFVPVIAALAAAVRLSDGGPAFYRQRRVGEHGREFDMIKLRTMRLDAEAGGTPAWNVPGDPRVTRLGRPLRRSHLDELPQLWNLLKGEMTLVGPRPERPGFVTQLAQRVPFYDRRHLVKPGLTGWAQVRCGYAGSDMGTAWKVCHDLYFLKHRSLALEMLIVLETLRSIVAAPAFSPRMPAEEFILGPPHRLAGTAVVADPAGETRLRAS